MIIQNEYTHHLQRNVKETYFTMGDTGDARAATTSESTPTVYVSEKAPV